MGCCRSSLQVLPGSLEDEIEKIITNKDIFKLEAVASSKEFSKAFSDVDSGSLFIKGLNFNLLGLCLWLSSAECFEYVHKHFNASIDAMEKIFLNQKMVVIDILCEKGCVELLDYYLPYYNANANETSIFQEVSETIDFSQATPHLNEDIINTYTPVHKTCEAGNINVISHIFNFYKYLSNTPYQLDINYKDEITGENCALISCRTGNYSMIRFLHTTCRADFSILNRLGETCLQILAASNKKKNMKEFHESFVYLVLQVGVDILRNYEEILLLLENEKSIMFYEKKLQEKGIKVDKFELEDKNRVSKSQDKTTPDGLNIDPSSGKDFNFTRFCKDNMRDSVADDTSNISSISRGNTVFSSMLSEFPTT